MVTFGCSLHLAQHPKYLASMELGLGREARCKPPPPPCCITRPHLLNLKMSLAWQPCLHQILDVIRVLALHFPSHQCLQLFLYAGLDRPSKVCRHNFSPKRWAPLCPRVSCYKLIQPHRKPCSYAKRVVLSIRLYKHSVFPAAMVL